MVQADMVYEDWKQNPYFGKWFSVLGDSISTLQGYNPEGYSVFYENERSRQAGVYTQNDTWWGIVMNFFGGRLLVNNSWSGSRVAKRSDAQTVFPSGCSRERTSGLHRDAGNGLDSVYPDVIMIYLGTNDWAFGAPLTSANPFSRNVVYFDVAYGKMLKQIHANYPKAQIWCCGLTSTYMSGEDDFRFPCCYGGIHIEKFNDHIRKNAAAHHAQYLDLYSYGRPYDTLDGTHPNRSGMDTLAELIIQETSKF